tara:strand:- start:3270 stop:3758 length:489 start_codon:yes stop_codon:yes gene_type:complete
MIKAIMACDLNGGLGKGDTMPWPHNKQDMKWFKKNTTDNVIVMGRTTWESPQFPNPLPNRVNVLVTGRPIKQYPGADIYISGYLPDALNRLEEQYPDKTIWVIGGADVFEQTFECFEEIYLTRINDRYDCDTKFDLTKIDQWELLKSDTTDELTIEIRRKPK